MAGRPKAALVEIQADEYRGGRPHRMHSALFAQTKTTTVALCRCAASAIKPYCGGTHKGINFRTSALDAAG